MIKIIVLIFTILLTSCAGVNSYQYSKKTFDVGSNVYLEGGSGTSKTTDSPKEKSLNLEYDDHSVTKMKTSIDFGMRLWDVMLAFEVGKIVNDFQKSIKDVTVEGDRRVVEEFKADTNYQRISLMRRSYGGRKIRGKGLPGFFSFQIYYDLMLDSTFSKLPNSEDKNIKGTGYGTTFGMHMSGLYYNIGYNWREYETSLKMEEFYLSIGLALQLF